MERDDIIRMARDAGLAHWDDMVQADAFSFALPKRLERFAALVAAHEREACALVLDKVIEHLYIYNYDGDASTELRKCAKAIRARGEEPKRHPGYIIGDHWLQAAYTRVCTGETEDEVMTDYGWQRARGEA